MYENQVILLGTSMVKGFGVFLLAPNSMIRLYIALPLVFSDICISNIYHLLRPNQVLIDGMGKNLMWTECENKPTRTKTYSSLSFLYRVI